MAGIAAVGSLPRPIGDPRALAPSVAAWIVRTPSLLPRVRHALEPHNSAGGS